MKPEKGPGPRIKKEKEEVVTLEQLKNMLEFSTSQLAALEKAGSQDRRLLEYLRDQKEKAVQEIARREKKK